VRSCPLPKVSRHNCILRLSVAFRLELPDLALQSPRNDDPREQETAEVGHGTLAGTHFGRIAAHRIDEGPRVPEGMVTSGREWPADRIGGPFRAIVKRKEKVDGRKQRE
jgi:hypothetical protein